MPDQPSSVVIIDRHEACRAALAAAIPQHGSGLRVAGSAGRVDEAIRNDGLADAGAVLLGAEKPDESNEIRTVRRIAPGACIVVVSSWTDGRSVVRALRAGALGYMPEWATPDEILAALDTAMSGTIALHSEAATNGLTWMLSRIDDSGADSGPLRMLTPRERHVLDLLEQGMSPSEIAAGLFLSKRTVQSHLQSAYAKLHVHGRVEALWEYKRLRRDVG